VGHPNSVTVGGQDQRMGVGEVVQDALDRRDRAAVRRANSATEGGRPSAANVS
jgi:hypothetical protein